MRGGAVPGRTQAGFKGSSAACGCGWVAWYHSEAKIFCKQAEDICHINRGLINKRKPLILLDLFLFN